MKFKATTFIVLLNLLIAGNLIAQDAPKEEFKPSGKIWGYVFGDYAYKVHADSLNRGSTEYSNVPKNYNDFEFRRIYLGYDYNLSEKFSTEFLVSYEGQTLADNNRTLFIKGANIKWKEIFKRADLIIGQSSTPSWSSSSEKLWGYRSIEKTIYDMRKFDSSNDLGLKLTGKFDDKGKYGYQFMLANGTSSKPETDQFKKVYAEVYTWQMDKKVFVDLYFDYERSQLSPYHKSKTTFKGTIGYQTDQITIGLEGGQQQRQNYIIRVDTAVTTMADTSDQAVVGISLFVRGQIIKDKLNFFARYDMLDSDANFSANDAYSAGRAPLTESFITAGVDFMPMKNVHIMPNIWYNAYKDRSNNVSGKVENDYDMALRLTLYYVYGK